MMTGGGGGGGAMENHHGNSGFDLSAMPSNSFNFNHSYGGGGMQQLQHAVGGGEPDEYETRVSIPKSWIVHFLFGCLVKKVRKFLELTRDEDNYEDKVRKFVEEASKYRKDRRLNDEKAAKKREKRKNRKLKKESKKKRKEKKSKTAKKEKDDAELREALK